MRRALLGLAAACAAGLGVAAGGALAPGASAAGSARAASPTAASHIQVTTVEYRLLLSRAVVHAGPVDLEEIDAGMDPHDLDLRYGHSPTVIPEPQLLPGQRYDGVVDLRPGVYHLWCSLPGHWKLGMHAILRVVR
ncbi:MAG TPA: hypothetical protein VHX66_08830 [Solirubrobacteraceae bacterium]|nr:hypothetical protein [Solirubrobacteraceae bacterium]